MEVPMSDVTRILSRLAGGDESARERLLEAVYSELRGIAARKLARESPGASLQATELVHEAWLRLVGPAPAAGAAWDKDRAYFFAACAEAMRRILVERARKRARLKHGGDRERLELGEIDPEVPGPSFDVLALDEALDRLEAEDPRKAGLVKLRAFSGLSLEDCALALEISPATADRDWAFAKAWLYHELRGERGNPTSST
jgi:RNA polymerase sigma factor (TIGR02999 family)